MHLKEELQEYINHKNLQQVVFLMGQINDMQKFYTTIDILILPSIRPEPFGLVIIEAMEYGLPVIATRHGGPMEIISDGVDGFLVEHENCVEMTEKISVLLRDAELRFEMGNRGKTKKRQKFNVFLMIENMESIYKEVSSGQVTYR